MFFSSCEFEDKDACERNISGHICITNETDRKYDIEIKENGSNYVIDVFTLKRFRPGKKRCSEILLSNINSERIIEIWAYRRDKDQNNMRLDTICFCQKEELILK